MVVPSVRYLVDTCHIFFFFPSDNIAHTSFRYKSRYPSVNQKYLSYHSLPTFFQFPFSTSFHLATGII